MSSPSNGSSDGMAGALLSAAQYRRRPCLSRVVDALLDGGIEGERGAAAFLFLAPDEVPAGHGGERGVGRETHVLLRAALHPGSGEEGDHVAHQHPRERRALELLAHLALHDPRVEHIGGDAAARPSAREAVDPGGHRELGGLIAAHLVAAPLVAAHPGVRPAGVHDRIDVSGLQQPVRAGPHRDNPRWRAGEKALLQEAGEQVRAKEVLREAAVDALARARLGWEQAARAVDQHVDRPAAREHGRRERAYLGGVAHVRAQELRRTADTADRYGRRRAPRDRKSTRLNSSHVEISYAVFCLKKKKKKKTHQTTKTKKKSKKHTL